MHSNCNYCAYYTQQAGSGFAVYKGLPHQRGYGLFSNVFKKYAFPLLKYIGKTGYQLGKQVGEDVFINKESPRESIKRRLKATAKNVAYDALSKAADKVSQIGTGRKRKRKPSKAKPAKRRKVTKRTKRTTTKRKTITPRRRRKTTKTVTIKSVNPGDIFGY